MLKNRVLIKVVAASVFFFICLPHFLHSDRVESPSNSAGIVEREIEKEYEFKDLTPEREVPLLEIKIPEEQLELEDGESVFIKTITLKGNDVIPNKEIRAVLSKYENLDLSMKKIQEVCLKIQEEFVKKGYFLARVFPPPQEIKEGCLTLEVLEGKLGAFTIEGQKHYKEKFIRKHFTKFKGRAVNYNQLLKTLFLLNENSDLEVSVVFKKGQETGTVDLIVKVKDAWPCHLVIDENNYGSKNTTLWRTGSKFDYGNLITDGDTLTLTEVLGNPVDHLNFTNVSYTLPLNTIGTKLNLNYLFSYFHVQDTDAPDVRGRSQVGAVEVTHALTRSRSLSTDLYTSFNYKQFRNYEMGKVISDDNLRILNVGVTLDGVDFLKGRNILDMCYTCGIPHFLGSLKTKTSKSSRTGSGGSFSILNVDYTRVQALPKHCFLFFHLSGQATPYKLPVSEQIYIGGIGTVRGFPMATAVGDDGYYGNLEIRTPLPWLVEQKVPFVDKKWKDFVQIFGFVDQGGVLLNGGGENQDKQISMTSAGMGIRLFAPFRINVDFDIGFPLTDNEELSSPVYYLRVKFQPF